LKRYVLRAVERALPERGKRPWGKGPVLITTDEDQTLAAAIQEELAKVGVRACIIAGKELADPQALRQGGGIQGIVHTMQRDPGAATALFRLAKTFHKDLESEENRPFILAVTRMDGCHGIAKGVPEPMAGAVTGLTKALRRELDKVLVKALDFSPATPPAQVARLAVDEILASDPLCEIGYRDGKRYVIEAVPAPTPLPACDLRGKSFLITGGGLGLGAELAKRLAAMFRARLVILGRTQQAREAAQWAALDTQGFEALKARLWQELKSSAGKKATPVLLDKEFSTITKAVELHRNLSAMRAAGALVEYIPCDLTEPEAVQRALRNAENANRGAFDVVIHAAGLEQSKLLADKTQESFQRVFDAKATAASWLLRLLSPKSGQRWLFFSSVVARFGNAGQTDYAAANDYLCKLAVHLRNRGVWACALDLTAFSGVGMASRGSIEALLKSKGVEFMDLPTGMALIIDELTRGDQAEVILAGALGKLDTDGLLKNAGSWLEVRDSSELAGPPTDVKTSPGSSQAGDLQPVLLSANPQPRIPSLVIERRFSLESDPYLKDHCIAGTPYVPGVIGIEMFLDAGEKLTGHRPQALRDVRFELPIKLLRRRPITVRIKGDADGQGVRMHIESNFIGPAGIKLGPPRVHFSASAPILSKPVAFDSRLATRNSELTVSAETIYRAYFHGPGFQVLSGIREIGPQRVVAELAPIPANAGPETVQGLPRLIEALFQACGYRDLHLQNRMTLPDSIELLQIAGRDPAEGPLIAVCEFTGNDPTGKSVYDAFLVDSCDRLLLALTGYKMIRVS